MRTAFILISILISAAIVSCGDDVGNGGGGGETEPDVVIDFGVPDGDDVVDDTVEDPTTDPDVIDDTTPDPDVDDDGTATPRQGTLSLTGGGGTGISENYVLTLYVGGPAPMGSSSNETHSINLGPGALNNQ